MQIFKLRTFQFEGPMAESTPYARTLHQMRQACGSSGNEIGPVAGVQVPRQEVCRDRHASAAAAAAAATAVHGQLAITRLRRLRGPGPGSWNRTTWSVLRVARDRESSALEDRLEFAGRRPAKPVAGAGASL